MFAKGLDIVPGIIAGEIDVAASALDGAIAGRGAGAPVFVVAGFAKGGARIVASKQSGITKLEQLKGKKVGVARGGAQELLLYAELANAAFTYDITVEHVQTVADLMFKYGVGKMPKPPLAKEFVKLDLLDEAKKALGVK